MVRSSRRSLKLESLESRLTLAGDGIYGDVAEVWDLNQEPTGSRVHASTELDGSLYYLVSKDDGDVDLWRTDGSNEGTQRIKEIEANQQSRPVTWAGGTVDAGGSWAMTTVNGEVYFAFDSISLSPNAWTAAEGQLQLWRSDGTDRGTTFVGTFPPWRVGGEQYWYVEIADAGGSLLVAASRDTQEHTAQLWSYNDVGEFTPYSQIFRQSWFPAIRDIVQLGDATYLLGVEQGGPAGLWTTTPAGDTTLVKEFQGSAAAGTVPTALTKIGETLYFTADGARVRGYDFWRSDGTPEGTQLVKEFVGGTQFPAWERNGDVHFLAPAGNGVSLWRTDGTDAGTTQVEQLPPGRLKDVAVGNDVVYFQLETDASESQIWKYADGTFDQLTSNRFEVLLGFESIQDSLLFVRWTGNPFRDELWMHNDVLGTTEFIGEEYQLVGEIGGQTLLYRSGLLYEMDYSTGTLQLIHDDNEFSRGVEPVLLTEVADRLYFYSRRDGQLYEVDQDVRPIVDAPRLELEQYSQEPITTMAATDNAIYVLGGSGLWKYDFLNDAGEWLLETLVPGVDQPFSGSHPSSGDYLIDVGQTEIAFYVGDDLWTTDGTKSGTEQLSVSDLTWREDLLHVGSRYYSTAWSDTVRSRTLHVSDDSNPDWFDLGIQVGSIVEFQEEIYTLRQVHSAVGDKYEIWKTDGTKEGTNLVSRFGEDVFLEYEISKLVASNGKLFFAEDGRLWCYDPSRTGIETSTTLVKRFFVHGSPNELADVNGRLFFAASEDSIARELWVSDGTPEGTVLAAGLSIGPWGSNPSQLTFQNDRLFFVANDVVHGEEIWSIDLRDSPELIGDINNNGEVDFLDFLILAENFGAETDAGRSAGDLDENGTVDFLDFIALAENFGGKRDVLL